MWRCLIRIMYTEEMFSACLLKAVFVESCVVCFFFYSICYTKWQQSSGGESWTKTHVVHAECR